MEVDVDDLAARMEQRFSRRGRGRPKGSKNRNTAGPLPPQYKPREDVAHSDLSTIVTSQIQLGEWMLNSLRVELRRKMNSTDTAVSNDDVRRYESLTGSIARAIHTLSKTEQLADELEKRMSPQQVLEAMARKLESQPPETVRYFIKRLKAHLDMAVPKVAPLNTAVDAMASLSALGDE